MSLKTLIFRYASFALVATFANLGIQRLILSVDTLAVGMAVAMVCGTLVGLLVKYILDKRWIFGDISTGMMTHGKKFTLYSAMGLFTTALFWATETAFWLVWKTDGMREAGAIIGLTVGYVVKYQLDRRFVFTEAQLAHPA